MSYYGHDDPRQKLLDFIDNMAEDIGQKRTTSAVADVLALLCERASTTPD